MTKRDRLKPRQIIYALLQVAKTTFSVAPRMAIIQVIGSVISAVLPIATTYFAAKTTTSLADAYAGVTGADQQVFLYVGLTAGLGIAMMAWTTVQSYVTQIMNYHIETAVTDMMYRKLYEIDFWRYDDKDTINQYDRAQRFATFFPHIFSRLSSVLTQVFTLIASLWVLIPINPWLAVIVIVAVVPGGVIQFKLSRMSSDHWRDNVETRRRLGRIEWSVFDPKVMAELRIYNVVKHLLKLRLELRDKDQKTRIEYERQYMFKRFGADVLASIAEVVALVWIVFEIIAQRQPIGQFLFVQQTVGRALSSVDGLMSMLNSMDEDLANLADYQWFMDLPVAKKSQNSLPVLKDRISIEGVTFNYPRSDTEVLKDVSLTIKQGQFAAVVGENGAGKTTFIKLLTGLYAPNNGRVLVDGHDLADVDVSSWHKQIALLGQDFIRYDFASAHENIWFGDTSKKPTTERIENALKMAEAAKFVSKLPKGGDSYLNNWIGGDDDDSAGMDISGGQWQRLALARNFYRDSSVVILDEPTSAIDALAESRIFKRLLKQKDKTIIAISHRLSTVEKADIIYMLEDGKVVESGTHIELVAKRGRYFRMFEGQLN